MQIKNYPNVDPYRIETTIFAFGLLDELARIGLPFIFKGGTSLLLLLDEPKRISTDIDIVVPFGVEFDEFFEKIKKRFPFYKGEERGANPNKYFRHFYFMFNGTVSNKECRINLDVAFEDNPYPTIIKKSISMPFLLTTGVETFISTPSIESILGDKLTAFAPDTIGVNPFMTSLGKPVDNRLQIVKQFFDIARLSVLATDLKEVFDSYKKCHEFENKLRNTNFSIQETLLDTYFHAAEIASMGQWNKNSSFYVEVVKPGIQGLTTNIFDGNYNQIIASSDAAKIMLLVSRLLTNKDYKDGFEFKVKELKLFKSVSDKDAFQSIKASLFLLKESKII